MLVSLFDNNVTTIDRKYKFTIGVQDAHVYDPKNLKRIYCWYSIRDDKLYSNLYFKPLPKKSDKIIYDTLIGDPKHILFDAIYRSTTTNLWFASRNEDVNVCRIRNKDCTSKLCVRYCKKKNPQVKKKKKKNSTAWRS